MTRYSPLAIVFVSLGLAACGGDDDSASAPSKAEYAKNAEQICRDTEKELENIGNGSESPDEVADAIDEVINESRTPPTTWSPWSAPRATPARPRRSSQRASSRS